MDSANIHHHQQHHQLQDQHVVVASSPLVLPSCYAAGSNSSSSTHAWTPNNNTILNTSNSFNACSNGETLSSRDHSWQQNNMLISSSLDGSMTQDHLNFHWDNNNNNISSQPSYDLHLSRLKNETTSDSSLSQSYMKIINNERRDLKDLNEKLLLRNYSSFSGFQLSSDDSNSSLSSSGSVTTMPIIRGSFNQFFPNLNDLNSFNHMSLANSSSNLDMNLQALDLFNSARLNDEGFGQLSRDQHQHGFFKDGFSYGIDHHMQQQPSLRPLNIPSNISSTFSNGVAEAKRSSSSIMLEPKAPQPPPKKSRIEPRATCPPFNVMKVRKEKLGDRIAALQQLVAPFGKTDTASVLMEAIGYIKFLQNQVETLSVPYMKSSRNKARAVHGGTTGNENEESKRDLRSRGLCLVPVSCLSYVADGGGGVWPPPPPNFGGGV